MAESVAYRHDGLELSGIMERPERANRRAVMVVHEAPGIGANVRRRARMLAELGYVAFVADLYGGGRSYGESSEDHPMHGLRGDPAVFRARVAAGFEKMLAVAGVDAAHAAAIGYCFGGTAVLELARSGTPVAAVVSFHGLLTTPAPAGPDEVRARVLACTGARDPLVPLDDVGAFSQEMDSARADWQLIVYGRALHSFTNPNVAGMGDPRMDYDPGADRQSWAAALLFLEEGLG